LIPSAGSGSSGGTSSAGRFTSQASSEKPYRHKFSFSAIVQFQTAHQRWSTISYTFETILTSLKQEFPAISSLNATFLKKNVKPHITLGTSHLTTLRTAPCFLSLIGAFNPERSYKMCILL
jgi:hypothetical protein